MSSPIGKTADEFNASIKKAEDIRTEEIKNVILGLAEAFEKQSEDRFGTIAEGLLHGKFGEYVNKPENFNLFFFFSLSQIMEIVYKLSMIANVEPGNKDIPYPAPAGRLSDVTMNYHLYRNIIGSVVKETEGDACYVDKLRWIINSYCKWIRTGELPDMAVGEKCYWKPHYGSAEEWISLCEGVYFLNRERIGKNALHDVNWAMSILLSAHQAAVADGVYDRLREEYERRKNNDKS